MFCKQCGRAYADNLTSCPYCGAPSAAQPVQQTKAGNGMAVAGFVLAFFVSLLGLIFSCIGLKNSKLPEYAGSGRGLSIAGIVISCLGMFSYLILIITLAAGAACLA